MQLGTLGKLNSVEPTLELSKTVMASRHCLWAILKEHCDVEKPNYQAIDTFLTWASGTKDWPADGRLTGYEIIGYLKIFADCVPTVK